MSSKEIKPSLRTGLVEEYYFSAKLAEIAEMKKRGIDVINLGIGSPDLPPSGFVINTLAVNAANPHNHGYQSYNGIPLLRKAFSEWYRKYFKVSLDPDKEILPLIGSKEGIMHISMAFIDPGDEVLVPDPGYPAYAAAAKLSGGIVRTYDLTEEGGWLPDIKEIIKQGTEKVKIMWINYPHMPTGTRASEELFRDLVSFARRTGILLCNDNPYSFILNDRHLSILSVEGAKETALELNSLSKSHNMAGWRIGMVGGAAGFIKNIIRVKSNMDSGMFQPLQAAAAEALTSSEEWYNELNAVYKQRRVIAEKIMKTLSCTFNPGQTGLFLWGRIPDDCPDAISMTDGLLYNNRVFITPGSVFGRNGNKYIRVSLCASEEVLNSALERISIINTGFSN
jgi:LL-diaminopimelate aminotransferase